MNRRQWCVVLAILTPLYAAAGLLAYWALWPIQQTMEVLYSHPFFCSAPCFTRDEAQELQVREVPSGTQYVWHYREIKVNAERVGTIRSTWVAGGFVWNSPASPTLGSRPGTYARSVAIQPPTSNPTRDFVWKTAFHYEVTPLRSEVIEFPDVHLRVVAR